MLEIVLEILYFERRELCGESRLCIYGRWNQLRMNNSGR